MSTTATIGIVVIGAALAVGVGVSLPEMRRYLKIRSM
jgi:hypothetical protein